MCYLLDQTIIVMCKMALNTENSQFDRPHFQMPGGPPKRVRIGTKIYWDSYFSHWNILVIGTDRLVSMRNLDAP